MTEAYIYKSGKGKKRPLKVYICIKGPLLSCGS